MENGEKFGKGLEFLHGLKVLEFRVFGLKVLEFRVFGQKKCHRFGRLNIYESLFMRSFCQNVSRWNKSCMLFLFPKITLYLFSLESSPSWSWKSLELKYLKNIGAL